MSDAAGQTNTRQNPLIKGGTAPSDQMSDWFPWVQVSSSWAALKRYNQRTLLLYSLTAKGRKSRLYLLSNVLTSICTNENENRFCRGGKLHRETCSILLVLLQKI